MTQISLTPKKQKRVIIPLLFPFRCISPDCKRNMELRRHITFLPSPHEPCPYCKERNRYIKLQVIHLIQPGQFGILKSSTWAEENGYSDGRTRFSFLCENSTRGFKELPRSPRQPRHYTEMPEGATCYYCLKEYNRINFPRGKIVIEF